MAEKLIGPQVNLTGTGGGDKTTTEYKPIDESAKKAISGTNPATGKAYTDAEVANIPGNYNPYAGAVGYKLEPNGELSILLANGTAVTTGATYKTTSQGAIVPDDKYMKNFNEQLVASGQAPIAFDEYGVQVKINPDGTAVDSQGEPVDVVYDENGNPIDGSVVNGTLVSRTLSTGIGNLPQGVTVVSTYTDPTTKDVTAVLSNGTTRVLAKSGAQEAERKSAYDLLYSEFNSLGIGALVPELKTFIEDGVSPAEFTLRLRQTESYKKRFAANAQRVAKGLRALSEAEYIGLEDQYQNVMRQYGLPETYYTRGDLGKQEGFEKFIAGDVSAAELEDRISTAQKRVINANPEVTQALKTFYPGISNGDILAYTLDPSKAIEDIKRKVTAAEIGGAAVRAGLTTSVADAEYLQRYGVTKEQADQGYQAAAQIVPRASQLADIYKQGPYTQATAEQEIFNLPGQVEAQRQRKKLTELETSAFSGRSGMGAIARERAGNF